MTRRGRTDVRRGENRASGGTDPLVSQMRVWGDPRAQVLAGQAESSNAAWRLELHLTSAPSTRSQSRLEVRIRSPEWRSPQAGVVVGLSAGGAEIQTGAPLRRHQIVFLECGPFLNLPCLRLYGRVRGLRTCGGHQVAGIGFRGRSARDLELLERYCTILRSLRADSEELPALLEVPGPLWRAWRQLSPGSA